MTTLEEQFNAVKERHPGATCDQLRDGSFLISVPDVPIADGWTAKTAHIRFIAPVQFPTARPDCFWADPALKLADGRNPQNTGDNPIPGGSPVPLRWYSWHVTQWSPNADTLTTYLNVVRKRFADPR
jgi:hypothetical protein